MMGSPVAATDERGYIKWRATYEPYGERIQTSNDAAASANNARWFTGHVQDVETNLVYMQARYYDATLGRFMAIDPAGVSAESPLTFNRYSYANNHPYAYQDPNGRSAVTKVAKFILKGGDAASTFADNVKDVGTVFNPLASPAERVVAGLSLASEVLPISIHDVKDAVHVGEKALGFAKKVETRFGSFLDDVAKKVTSPNGRKGGLPHQAKIDEIEADIIARDLEPVREIMVKTPGGEKSTRFIDIGARNKNGDYVETYQVGKATKAGKPVAREVRALDDIELKGQLPRPQFKPYNK